jgi:hypothetical protein
MILLLSLLLVSKLLCIFGIVLYILALRGGCKGRAQVFCFIPFNNILRDFPYIF